MGTRKIPTKSQYEDLAAFRFELRQFLRFSEEAAAAAGVTAQQYQALLVIKGFPGRDYVTVGELAERLLIRHHSAVGLVDRLMHEDLVTRNAADDDRRQVHIRLTPRGDLVLADLASIHREKLRFVGPELRALLQRVNQGESKPLD